MRHEGESWAWGLERTGLAQQEVPCGRQAEGREEDQCPGLPLRKPPRQSLLS